MMAAIVHILTMTVKITFIVFAMMVVIEYLQLRYRKTMRRGLTGPRWVQYLVAAALGVTPGCVGAFFVVSLYMRGLTSFGALAAVLIATSGDGAFVLLTETPQVAPLLFAICGVAGVAVGCVADGLVDKFGIVLCQDCEPELHDEDLVGPGLSPAHFVREHVYHHIIRQHLPSLFLWLLGAFVVVELIQPYMDVRGLPVSNLVLVVIAAGIGILPESGAHLAFVLLFAEGAIPFSVLLAISIVQDGHGLIPLLSASVRDSVYVKAINMVAGLIIGLAALGLGY